jgi:hypothetical protein
MVKDLVDNHPTTKGFHNWTPQSDTLSLPLTTESVNFFEDDIDVSPADLLKPEFFCSGQEVTEGKAPLEIKISWCGDSPLILHNSQWFDQSKAMLTF